MADRTRRWTRLLVVCSLALCGLSLGLGGCARETPADHAAALPADTVLWLRADNPPALAASLQRHGVWDLLVAELDKAEVREKLSETLGVTVSADPAADLRNLLASLASVDVSLHPPVADADADAYRFGIRVTAHKDELLDDLTAAAARRASGTRSLDGATVHLLTFGEDQDQVLSVWWADRTLLAANDGDLLASLHSRLARPADAGLAGTTAYRQAQDGKEHDLRLYLSPDFPGAAPTVLRGPAAASLPAMPSLVEKYGSQALYLGLDYGLTRMVMRATMAPDSPLLPLFTYDDRKSRLLAQLPADTYACLLQLVQVDARKAELFNELLQDIMAAAPQQEQLPVPVDDPLAMMETMLGFALVDAASLTTEVAVAGTASLSLLMLLHTESPADAERLLDMLLRSPALAFLPKAGEREVAGAVLHAFSLPMDPEGRLHALARRDQTVMMLIGAKSDADLDACVAGGASVLSSALPTEAHKHLGGSGHGWSYVDIAAMAQAHGGLLDDMASDLPAPLAQRLRNLVLSARVTAPSPGVAEWVTELGGR
ncbi:MAG: hypothetical protein RBT60_10510 [Candidatus Krumholzibacteria bacterium]|jgi:hypothetical protein|nr:hypothetical protein [Candidatus Krumholzibacteria bacterium]